MKFNLLSVALFSLFFLLLVKVVISGIFLQLKPLDMGSPQAAIAAEPKTEPAADINDTELMLRRRQAALDEKEAQLKDMEERLLPLKAEVEARIEELNELQATLTAYSKDLAEREMALKDAKISHLVKLYSSMDAGKAAVIMDKLPVDTVVRIMGNMNGKSAGQILASMPPEKGAQISQQLSKEEW